ncbi:MerR family transcriptional regulator [Lacticaseibacillus baoqingensis]|uniref:MerR family transcriptional regulator n=1 Tax=Lacticaseibacillus baoqingensis TaxID=2486013 RepID=A0ABW4E8M2_9LACO|nr:MerR family transcriptional regulator [Lacticaseibacillus baoqingensis]
MELDFMQRVKSLDISVGIGEASRITGATVTQIRYWEKKGMVRSFRREDGANKRFDLKNIIQIMLISSLIEAGYTLTKAGEMIRQHHHQTDRLKFLARSLTVEETNAQTRFNFGQLVNDLDYDVVADVDDDHAEFRKVPHQPDRTTRVFDL